MGKLFSTTWSYFTKVDEKLAECKLCQKIVKTSGNTSNARNHLKVKHKLTDEEIRPISNKKNQSEELQYTKNEPICLNGADLGPNISINIANNDIPSDIFVISDIQEDIEILEQVPSGQNDEQPDENYEMQQSEVEEKEEIYCLEMLEDDEEVSEDSRHFEQKQSRIVVKRSLEDSKRTHRHSSPQQSSDSNAPRYDFSSAVDIFFASMAATVKQMPPEKIVLVKQKIATIVFQEELQQLRNEGYQYVQE